MLVDGRIFFDEKIPLGHVGLWLVVVVIRDKVFNRIAGEKLPHFGVKLGCKGLVGGQHQGRTPRFGDDMGHAEGLAGPCYSQQRLVGQALTQPIAQARDGLGLIAGWGEGGHQFKGAVWVGNGL